MAASGAAAPRLTGNIDRRPTRPVGQSRAKQIGRSPLRIEFAPGEEERAALRALDANVNRLRDGLRVVEDTLRFALSSPLGVEARDIRRALARLFADRSRLLVAARRADEDSGRRAPQRKHENIAALLRANFARCSEALRVLEEYTRLVGPFSRPSDEAALKKIRFGLYALETRLAIARRPEFPPRTSPIRSRRETSARKSPRAPRHKI